MTNDKTNGATALIGDIGGTNARFALARNGQVSGEVTILACRDHADLAAAANTFLHRIPEPERPRCGVIAIASPVIGDRVQVTNLRWAFSIDELRQDLGFDALDVVNDFTAVAWAIPHLKADQRRQVGGGAAQENAPIAVVGPGSGLGVAGLFPTRGGWTILPTEAGHVTQAATTIEEDRVLDTLRRTFGHVSAERVVSGPGLVNIYSALTQLDGQPPEDLSPAEISARALSDPGSRAAAALDMFCGFLGTMASNVAMNYDARGGVYLGGGILDKLGDAFVTSGFRERFEAKGRFSAYLSQIPTFVVTHPFPALAGLAAAYPVRTSWTQMPG